MALHLKFALSLETIADEMIDKVAEKWTSPFDAPTVIFSEYKLEQWFRLRWLEKRGVLANLNRKSIDKFLMEILVGDNPNTKKLSADMLRNVIIAYLQKKDEFGKANFEKLDERVCRYLLAGGNSVDEHRLFDLANKLSGLFLEYETSRPSEFIKKSNGDWEAGILDCWKQGNLKPFFVDKNGREVENEEWERNLYSAIFHSHENKDSMLTDVFKKMDKDCTYLTLPFMYEACKVNGKPAFHFDSSKPVFILGLAGMGQFYRVVLQEFAKDRDVYAYIQNPCMQFWEDVPNHANSKVSLSPAFDVNADPEEETDDVSEFENSLLRAWGRAGRDNIKLWSMADDYIGGFSDDVMEPYARETGSHDTFLHELQWMIANRTNKFSEGYIPRKNEKGVPFGKLKDRSLTITAAPNRIREVEAVHSQICQLLQGGANIRDVLVVCPDLANYRSAIYQVFDQTETGTATNVALKFVIVDSAAKESLVGEALQELFSIKKKGALSRTEFFALVRNPVVQEARKINADDVSDWETWISGMNVYRDHTAESNAQKDWLKGVKRLLLARLTNSCVAEEYLPYADMESANNAKLNQFIDTVYSLETWLDDKETPVLKTDADFLKMQEFLNSWLLMQDVPGGFGGEIIIFENVQNALEGLKSQLAAGLSEISWNMVEQTLMEAAQTSEYSCGSPLINGVTFMNFVPNRTIPIKHLFFMGANAKDFPGSKSFDSLDLRKSVARWPGDDTVVEKNRYAFLCQFMSTSESFHISYQGMYLPKDEELYPSSIVNDLQNALQIALPENEKAEDYIPKIELKIDEYRPRCELFTARENRNKDTLTVFRKTEDEKVKPVLASQKMENELPERVSVSEIRRFLEDPFEFQVNRVMKVDEAEEDPEKMALEPIKLSDLDKSIWLKAVIAEKLGSQIEETEKLDKNLLQKKGALPQGAFGDKIWEDLDALASRFEEKIVSEYPKDSWNFISHKLDVPIEKTGGEKAATWTLTGNIRLMAINRSDDKQVALVDVKDKSIGNGVKEFILSYVEALAMLAETKAKSVTLAFFDIAEKTKNINLKKIEVRRTKDNAQELLNSIYDKMYGKLKNWKIIPFELYKEKISSLFDLKEKVLGQDGAWKYFTAKNLFDVLKPEVSGFSNEDLEKDGWKSETKKMLDMLPELDNYMKSKEKNNA